MSDQTFRDPALSAGELDDRWQMAVLGHLLLAYPAPFTLDEIETAFVEPFGPRSFEEADGIQRILLTPPNAIYDQVMDTWGTRVIQKY